MCEEHGSQYMHIERFWSIKHGLVHHSFAANQCPVHLKQRVLTLYICLRTNSTLHMHRVERAMLIKRVHI